MMTTKFNRYDSLSIILCELHVRLKAQAKVDGETVAARMNRPVAITLALGDWHLIKGVIADALNFTREMPPFLVSAEPPKRRWWQVPEHRRQDVRGALTMLGLSSLCLVGTLVFAACTTWN